MFAFDDTVLSLAYVVLGIALVLIAKIAKDLLTPYSIDEELTTHDNLALATSMAGYYGGVVAIFLGASLGDEIGTLTAREAALQIAIDFGYALGGIVLLNVGRKLVDWVVLPKFCTKKEIIEDRNLGTGAVEGGAYLATALVVAGAIHGDTGGILSALVFFIAGQIALLLFARFYDWMTPYDLHDEIERDNAAAGVAFGGSLVAIGVVLLRATSLEFHSWGESAVDFAGVVVLAFVCLAVARQVADRALLPKSKLSHEIAVDRNIGAALIEATTAIGLAAVIFFTI